MTMYDRIKQRRIALKMSQDELARKVGYQSRSAISKVENGDRDISQSMIAKYAEALGVSPSYLLYGEETPAEETSGGRIEEFIELFQQLTDEQQAMIISSIKGILTNQ